MIEVMICALTYFKTYCMDNIVISVLYVDS